VSRLLYTYASNPDLTDQPLLKPEIKWFSDGSNFVLNGQRKAGYAEVSHEEVLEAWTLLAGTFSKRLK
jgi:hypothetical protein